MSYQVHELAIDEEITITTIGDYVRANGQERTRRFEVITKHRRQFDNGPAGTGPRMIKNTRYMTLRG